MGISTEQWRVRIGTYNGGRGRRMCGAHQSSFSHHAVSWTTGEIMNTTPLTVQAGVAFVSLWMVLCAISSWWKKIESSHPTKLNRGSSYHWSKDTRTTVSITVCVSLVTAAAVLLHCLTLLPIMAGDVELNPGPGMDTELTDANLSEMFEMLYKAREKWYNIGIYLELSIDDLSSIQRQNREDSDKCLSQMLKKLLETRRDGLTWNKLCTCLRSITVDRNDVAEQIERQFNFEDEVIIRLERKRPHPENDKGESLILSEISTNKNTSCGSLGINKQSASDDKAIASVLHWLPSKKKLSRSKTFSSLKWVINRLKLNKVIYKHDEKNTFRCKKQLEIDVGNGTAFNPKLTLILHPCGLAKDMEAENVTLVIHVSASKKAPPLEESASVVLLISVTESDNEGELLNDTACEVNLNSRVVRKFGIISHEALRKSWSEMIVIEVKIAPM